MSVIQGEGEYRYEISNDWAKVPAGMEWREVGAIAIDDKDNVYVFNRGPHPMMVFDRAGTRRSRPLFSFEAIDRAS